MLYSGRHFTHGLTYISKPFLLTFYTFFSHNSGQIRSQFIRCKRSSWDFLTSKHSNVGYRMTILQ